MFYQPVRKLLENHAIVTMFVSPCLENHAIVTMFASTRLQVLLELFQNTTIYDYF